MKIGFLGFGNMAQALAKGLLRKEAVAADNMAATAVHMEKLKRNTEALGMKAFESTAEMIEWADWVIVAIKPYQLENVLPEFQSELQDKAILSVAAGKSFEDIEALIPGTRHISTVPNLPVSVGEGMVACEYQHSLTDEDVVFLEEILGKIGSFEYLPTEQLQAAGTIGGCSPAYVAMFAEALTDAAVKHGLSRTASRKIVYQMLTGTAQMLQDDIHPALLKEMVCSPGGTTIKGVASLEYDGFRGAVIAAIDEILN